jgi:transposase
MPSIVDKSSVIKVCVDDFALKKRFSYGTMMVNFETHRIIDMIPSRETTEVKNWLATFPNIQVVSRDGASTYASATSSSHPDAVQVSDRFHLIKGLSEVVNKYIIRQFPARVEIPLTETITEEMKALYNTANRSLRIQFAHKKRKEGLTVADIALLLHSSPTTISKYLAIPEEAISDCNIVSREKQHRLAMLQKQQEVDEARKLVKSGYPIEQVAAMMHHTYKTIQNYLDPNYSIVNGHYNVRIPGKLAPYEREVLELRSKGMTYPKIHNILCEKGYTGSVASLRMFMQKERVRMQEQEEQSKTQSEFVQRKSLCQLIYKKLENVTAISLEQYKQVLKTYPELSELYSLVKEFHAVIFSKKPEKLNGWIEAARKFDIPELQTFLEGISKDIKAVKNGIAYTFNNGLAEGSVNKIKVIKRIMYGRNSFELLKAKVLFHELFCCEVN